MNFERGVKTEPLRVLIVNSLSPTAQLIVINILRGQVFGRHQLVDVVLLVYSNEVSKANGLKLEFERCALECTNSIKVSSDLPRFVNIDYLPTSGVASKGILRQAGS